MTNIIEKLNKNNKTNNDCWEKMRFGSDWLEFLFHRPTSHVVEIFTWNLCLKRLCIHLMHRISTLDILSIHSCAIKISVLQELKIFWCLAIWCQRIVSSSRIEASMDSLETSITIPPLTCWNIPAVKGLRPWHILTPPTWAASWSSLSNSTDCIVQMVDRKVICKTVCRFQWFCAELAQY
jgi:hypothetical protein